MAAPATQGVDVRSTLDMSKILLKFRDPQDEASYQAQRLVKASRAVRATAVLLVLSAFASATDNFENEWVVFVFFLGRFVPLLGLLVLSFVALHTHPRLWSSAAAVVLTISTAAVHFVSGWCDNNDDIAADLWSCDAVQIGTTPWQPPLLLLLQPGVMFFALHTTWLAAVMSAVITTWFFVGFVMVHTDSEELVSLISTVLVWMTLTLFAAYQADIAERLTFKASVAAQRKLNSLTNERKNELVRQQYGQRFSQLLKRTDLVFLETDAEAMILMVYGGVKSLYDKDPHDLQATNYCGAVHRESSFVFRSAIKQLVSGRLPAGHMPTTTSSIPVSSTPVLDGDIAVDDMGPVTGREVRRTSTPEMVRGLVLTASVQRLHRDGTYVWVDVEGFLIPGRKLLGTSKTSAPSVLLIERPRVAPPPAGRAFVEIIQDSMLATAPRLLPAEAFSMASTAASTRTPRETDRKVDDGVTKPMPPMAIPVSVDAVVSLTGVSPMSGTVVAAGSGQVSAAAAPAAAAAAGGGAAGTASATGPGATPSSTAAGGGGGGASATAAAPTAAAAAAAAAGAGGGKADGGAGATPTVRPGQPKALLGQRVLFVDDDPVNRRLGARMLGRLGCTYTLLEDGDQVADALRSDPSHTAVLMDIVMQRSDGAMVCQELREGGCQLPIIAMTGHTGPADAQRFVSVGFDVVLPKPFDIKAMGRALVEACNRRSQKQA